MKIAIFYTLMILGGVFIGTAFAEESLISIVTDDDRL